MVISCAAAPPNVVFIISDDQAWNDYGFMGHEHIETPHLDKLAESSLTFTRGTTHVPLCRPSLSTMLTGLYPHQHGVTGNDPSLPEKGTNPQSGRSNPKFSRYYNTIIENFSSPPNLARELTKDAYLALQTGKWWEGRPIEEAGFTHSMTRGVGEGARHGDDGLEIGRKGLKPITDFLDQAEGKPFFIWYAPFLPHTPHTPPKALLEKYLPLAPSEAVARYWACVEWFDQTCGQLLGELESRKLLENTIVVYTCDNGWVQDPKNTNAYAPRSKRTPYEGGVRTPIMISWPGKIAPRRDETCLAGNIDLWPTVPALLGRDVPKSLPGINLNNPEILAKRQSIFGEAFAHDIANVDAPTKSLEARYIIKGWDKLIVYPGARAPELFNLKDDPWERNELSGKNPEMVNKLQKELDSWWTP